MDSIGIDEPIADDIIQNILRGRPGAQVTEVIAARTYNQTRNKHELLLLARLIDCMRDGRRAAAIELACRRLSGVQLADTNNNWEMANALLKNTEGAADLPDSVLRRVLKTAANMTSLLQTAGKGASSSSSGGGRGGGKSGSSGKSGAGGRSRGSKSQGGSSSNGGGTKQPPSGGAPAGRGAGQQ